MRNTVNRRSVAWQAAGILALLWAALFAGLLPLTMPLGLAAGGTIETGQVAVGRWWLGGAGALLVFLIMSFRWSKAARLWGLGILLSGLAVELTLFVAIASGRPPAPVPAAMPRQPEKLRVGVVTALPLFWTGDAFSNSALPEPASLPLRAISAHRTSAIDLVDRGALARIDRLLIVQPRLLQPGELVAIDDWIRTGGKAVILADPLLVWPSDLPPGDPRRAPLTSLLDPLMTHWGLTLAPAEAHGRIERRTLKSGHVLLLAGSSRFERDGSNLSARCELEERGLFALCRVGKGTVRLVADADPIDSRLWLADPRWPERAEVRASDIAALLDGWLADPLDPPLASAPRRIASEAALIAAVRWAMLSALGWAVLGWSLRRFRFFPTSGDDSRENTGKKQIYP